MLLYSKPSGGAFTLNQLLYLNLVFGAAKKTHPF